MNVSLGGSPQSLLWCPVAMHPRAPQLLNAMSTDLQQLHRIICEAGTFVWK